MNELFEDWEEDVSQDDMCSSGAMEFYCKKKLTKAQYATLEGIIKASQEKVTHMSGWRIEGTLREFPKFQPINLWFDYPIHKVDRIGTLKDIEPDGEKPSWKRNLNKKKTPEEAKKERMDSLETAFEACGIDEKITVKAMSEFMAMTEKTVRNRLKEHGGFWIDEGIVGKK